MIRIMNYIITNEEYEELMSLLLLAQKIMKSELCDSDKYDTMFGPRMAERVQEILPDFCFSNPFGDYEGSCQGFIDALEAFTKKCFLTTG